MCNKTSTEAEQHRARSKSGSSSDVDSGGDSTSSSFPAVLRVFPVCCVWCSMMALGAVVLAVLLCGAQGIMFHLQPNTHKCFREEIHKNVLVSGEYEVQEAPGQKVDIQVTDSKGHHLYNKEEAESGKFIFNTEDYDIYEICFSSRVPPTQRGIQQEVTLKTKHGVEAKTYEALGEAAKLKPLEIELKRLEDLSESIVQDFSYMRQREEEMRDTNAFNVSALPLPAMSGPPMKKHLHPDIILVPHAIHNTGPHPTPLEAAGESGPGERCGHVHPGACPCWNPYNLVFPN